MVLRPLLVSLLIATALPLAPLPVMAETTVGGVTAQRIGALTQTLKMDDIFQVMLDEGVDYGTSIEEEMFPGRGGVEWLNRVRAIYDKGPMRERFEDRLLIELASDPAAVDAAMQFFGSARGQRIVDLEIAARKTLLDDAAVEAARVTVEDMIAEGHPRIAALQDFAETNELVELNVAASLNGSMEFYKGLSEGGAFGPGMTEEEILSDVWGQEPQIRADTEEWLFGFLVMAYQPLSDDDLAAYQAFAESAAGQKVNRALFAAFGEVFVPVSRAMGRASAAEMAGEDI
jgi:hypothetical protein